MRVNGSEGAIAQLGERCNRTAEVVSSNLIGSTNQNKRLDLLIDCFAWAGAASLSTTKFCRVTSMAWKHLKQLRRCI